MDNNEKPNQKPASEEGKPKKSQPNTKSFGRDTNGKHVLRGEEDKTRLKTFKG